MYGLHKKLGMWNPGTVYVKTKIFGVESGTVCVGIVRSVNSAVIVPYVKFPALVFVLIVRYMGFPKIQKKIVCRLDRSNSKSMCRPYPR